MQRALAHRITTIPPRLAYWRAGLEKRPFLAAATLGACAGIMGTICSLAVLVVALQFLPPEAWGNSAASQLGQLSLGAAFFLAVVYAPVIETVLGQVMPIELAHRLGAPPAACLLLSGFVFGCGHYLNGGLVHGITAFFAGTIFACAYVAFRWIGIGPGLVAASSAHAVQNLGLLFVIAPFFPHLP